MSFKSHVRSSSQSQSGVLTMVSSLSNASQTANPKSATVHMFIHFDSATSSSPALHWFSAYTGCLESEPVTIETTLKDKVEERGRDAAAYTGLEGGSMLVMLWPSDWS